jgi:ParB family chromosome partitioning protein
MERKGLGRGLSALLADVAAVEEAPERPARVAADRTVPIDRIRPNPNQPRRDFGERELQDLAASIREKGVIQPLILRQHPQDAEDFEIVAGERRWRAATRAGILRVPVVVRDVPDDKRLEIALIENIQREDLNPIEEAAAYRRLADDLHLTQEKIAQAVGKDRASIANYLRLLRLPEEVRAEIASGRLSMGHARALVAPATRRRSAARRAR